MRAEADTTSDVRECPHDVRNEGTDHARSNTRARECAEKNMRSSARRALRSRAPAARPLPRAGEAK